jgi:predicted metalloprotease with PDZ domain
MGINRILGKYQNSSRRNTNLKYIAKNYDQSADKELFKLPYEQGLIMALKLDQKIKIHTNLKYSLDDVIRELLAQLGPDNPKNFETKELEIVFDKYAGEGAFMLEYNKIVRGDSLEPPRELGECAELVHVQNNFVYKINNINACALWFKK